MDDSRSVIERGLARAGSESYTLESFYRRRDRKRARTRFTAGVVGLAIAIVLAVVGSAILRSAPEDKDVGGNGPQLLRDGEVLQVVDEYGDSATFVATDLESGAQRLIHRCVIPSGDTACGYIREFDLRPKEAGSPGSRVAAAVPVARPGCGRSDADGPPVHVTSSGGTDSPGWVWAWSPATEQLALATQHSGSVELVLSIPQQMNARASRRTPGSPRCRGLRMGPRSRSRRLPRACPSSIS